MLLRTKLLIQTIILIAVLSFAGGGIGLYYTHAVADISLKLVEEEAIPILDIKTLEKQALEIWLRLLLHSSVTNMDTMTRVEQELPQWQQAIDTQIDHISVFYQGHEDENGVNHQEQLGETQRWNSFRQAWQHFLKSSEQALTLSQNYEKKQAMQLIQEGEVWKSYQALSQPLEELVKQHQEHMNMLRDQAINDRQQAGWIIILLSAFIGLLALLVMMRFSQRLLVTPLHSFQTGLLGFFDYLNRNTHTAPRINIHSHDELGTMSRLINDNVGRIEQNIIKDTLFIKDVAGTVSKIKAGDLQDKVTVIAGNPALNELKTLLNEVLAIMIEVLSNVGKNLDGLAQGQLSERVEGHYQGEYARLQHSCNGIAKQIEQVFKESDTVLKRLSSGEMSVRITGQFAGDFTGIKTATNDMAHRLQQLMKEVSSALEQLADGQTNTRISGEFPGEFNDIRCALDTTAKKLAAATTQNAQQNWLKTGQSQLSEQLSGDKDSLHLAEDIINFLTPYLEAQVGALYLWHTEDEAAYLKMTASHAFVRRKGERHEFALGEGIIGQAALEHKSFILEEPPSNYMLIQSGLGHASPKTILIAPFLYENEVKGVIELASTTTFTDVHLDFIQQILPAIAIALNTAESRHRMKKLLEQSRVQSTELREQQHQMERQQDSLQETNEKLQQQSEELQSQAEELQVQQEELRQTNEALEQRTLDLEQQQTAVEEKNLALEKAKTAIQIKADELEITGKYKSEFLANMSHELRTPLNSLLILAQMLAANKQGHLDEKEIQQAHTIHNAGQDLLSLINDILDLSKVESGKFQLHIETFSLKQLLDDVYQRFLPLAERKPLKFDIHVAKNIPPDLTSDIQRIKQVLTNLLSNAFKFTEQGEIKLEVYRPQADEVSAMNLSAQRSLAFCITDSGIGIPADKLQVIFEAFQQVDGTTSRRFGGTGLGLSISRQLARLLGGDIQLHSVEHQGSRFTFYVLEQSLDARDSIQQAPQTHISTVSSEPIPTLEASLSPSESPIIDDREHLNPDDKHLLIIDDDPQFVDILQQAGHEEGYQCLVADNGRDGLALAQQYLPDAIILDIGLPLIDGLTVMDQLKQNLAIRHIPVQVISAGEHGHKVRQMGALSYHLKPVNIEQLRTVFARFQPIVAQQPRHLLLISEPGEHRQSLESLLTDKSIKITCISVSEFTHQTLIQPQIDGAVVDMQTTQTLPFLEQLRTLEHEIEVPLIFYAKRELSHAEAGYLHEWHGESALKIVYSPERLVDEVSLFLHQIEAELAEENRQMLHQVHNKEAVLKDRRVLLVDDDMRNVYALSSVLESKGMQVIPKGNGQQALTALEKESHIDIVLMDIMMPKMDGYDTMRRIRQQARFHQLPIIALTAKAMKDDRKKCMEAGANDYLAKPINSDQLISLLRVWLYQ